jgi:hypothetical protein
MLVIRPEQMAVFNAYAERSFENEMAEHLRSHAPWIVRFVDDRDLQRIVHTDIRRARGYDLTRRWPISLFLELSLTLGCGFDTDPQLRWASEALSAAAISTDMLRAQRLYEGAVAYFEKVIGEDYCYLNSALQKLTRIDLASAPEEALAPETTLSFLADIYPEKFSFIGEAVARALVLSAAAEANSALLPGPRGAAVIAGMKFVFGHRICDDPYYPGISAVMRHSLPGDDRLTQLLSGAGDRRFQTTMPKET